MEFSRSHPGNGKCKRTTWGGHKMGKPTKPTRRAQKWRPAAQVVRNPIHRVDEIIYYRHKYTSQRNGSQRHGRGKKSEPLGWRRKKYKKVCDWNEGITREKENYACEETGKEKGPEKGRWCANCFSVLDPRNLKISRLPQSKKKQKTNVLPYFWLGQVQKNRRRGELKRGKLC